MTKLCPEGTRSRRRSEFGAKVRKRVRREADGGGWRGMGRNPIGVADIFRPRYPRQSRPRDNFGLWDAAPPGLRQRANGRSLQRRTSSTRREPTRGCFEGRSHGAKSNTFSSLTTAAAPVSASGHLHGVAPAVEFQATAVEQESMIHILNSPPRSSQPSAGESLQAACARMGPAVPPGEGPCSGNSNQNVLPRPTSLSTPISPPCASTASLQKVRPRPVEYFRRCPGAFT